MLSTMTAFKAMIQHNLPKVYAKLHEYGFPVEFLVYKRFDFDSSTTAYLFMATLFFRWFCRFGIALNRYELTRGVRFSSS